MSASEEVEERDDGEGWEGWGTIEGAGLPSLGLTSKSHLSFSPLTHTALPLTVLTSIYSLMS
jgi:hypothetical protein